VQLCRRFDVHSNILKRIFIPAYYSFNKDRRLEYLKILEAEQWLSHDEINAHQFESIQAIIMHAYNSVPFYKSLWAREGLTPSDIKDISDFRRLPFLNKCNIQNNLSELTSTNYSSADLIADASGGSTGIPTNFYTDGLNIYKKYSFIYRHDRWCGWNFGQKTGVIWGSQREIQRSRAIREKLLQRYLFRTLFLDAFDLSESKVEAFIRILNREKPVTLLGYANAMFLVARIIQQKGWDVYKPKGIIVSAETLTSEKRILIESVFRCKVLNRYGSREVGMIASECREQEGLHIASENVFLEIIKDGQPAETSERGEIVVTDLHNYAMPLIRYRTGDIGAFSSKTCSCGRGLPLLKEVCGRQSDFFVTKNGSFIHGEYFTHLFYGIRNVKQFRIVQESADSVHVKIVSLGDIPKSELERVLNEVKHVMEGADVTMEMVSQLDIIPSGKYMFTVSKIQNSIIT
jgi:phenylacetate-CoA ligase